MKDSDLQSEHEVAAGVVRRIADDLAWLANRTLHVDRVVTERAPKARAVGDSVSIGFRFLVEHGGRKHHGLLCMPLSEAITFSAGLLGYDPKASLEAGALDAPTKELKAGMVELSKFVAKAAKVQLARSLSVQTRGEGSSCVGLRPGSLPQIPTESELVTVSAEWSFHRRDPFAISLALEAGAFEAGPQSDRQAA